MMFNHKIVDTVTGEETIVPFTDEETNEMLKLVAESEAQRKAQEDAKVEAQAKRVAALAKLEALGLDEDDLKALGL